MHLFGIDSAQEASRGFNLAGANKAKAPAPDAEAVESDSDRPSGGTSIMASHFVHSFKQESRYVAGLKTGLALQNDFLDQMQAVVAGYKDLVDMSGDPSYAKDAAKAVGGIVDNEVQDTNVDKLEEISEDIEEKAEEAVAPESEKVLKDDATPKEALDESLDEATPEAQAAAGDGEKVAEEPGTQSEPVAAAEADQPQAAAPETATVEDRASQEQSGSAMTVASIDLVV